MKRLLVWFGVLEPPTLAWLIRRELVRRGW